MLGQAVCFGAGPRDLFTYSLRVFKGVKPLTLVGKRSHKVGSCCAGEAGCWGCGRRVVFLLVGFGYTWLAY